MEICPAQKERAIDSAHNGARTHSVRLIAWLLTVLLGAPALTVVTAVEPVQAIDKQDFRINDDAGPAPQSSPQIAVQANGDFFVTWVDRRTGRNDLYYQRFDALGNALGRNALLTTTDTTSSERFQVSIAANISGVYAAVWKDFRNGSFPFNPDIYQTFFDSTGKPSGAEYNWTALSTDSIFEDPDVALGNDGSGVVVWAEHRNGGWDIVGERFDPSGAPVGGMFVVNDDGFGGQQHAPAVSISTLGWFVVCWYDNRTGNDDIYYQVYDAAGSPVGGNARAHDLLTTRQAFPDVACDGSGRFTLCWVDWRNGTYPQNPDIYTRRFNADATPIDSARLVFVDLQASPQRDPAIATDRLGNVVIVWADSSNLDWNIRGRVIDHRGLFVDTAIQINSDTTTGRQAQPVVAMDGFDIRVAWADYRNGNFDVYGRIMNYNQPAIVVTPASVDFTMHKSGPAPASVPVELLNAGIGALDYSISDTVSWLSVSQTSGLAPDTVALSVAVSSLAPGTYFAALPVIDNTNLDSSNAINVSLTVTTSTFNITPAVDTMVALAQLGTPATADITIGNSGSGQLNWQAVSLTPWLTLSATSGSDNDVVTLQADPTGLSFGFYDGSIVFTDTDASNSPDTLQVTFKYASDVPYITFSSDSVSAQSFTNSSTEAGVRALNAGGNTLQWSAEVASTASSWLKLKTNSGVGGDSLLFLLKGNSLTPGAYRTTVTVTDSAALNSPKQLPVNLSVVSADTMYFADNVTPVGGQLELAVTLGLHDSVQSIHLPLALDTSLFFLDTLYLADVSGNPDYVLSWIYDSLTGNVDIDFSQSTDSSGVISTTTAGFLRILLTPASHEFAVPTSQLLRSDDTVMFAYQDGRVFQPYLSHGTITVGSITAVEDGEGVVLPERIRVSQNYPNPFNAETRFDVELPTADNLRVRIYNVLGQVVRTVFDGRSSPGVRTLRWDGRTREGREAPSGIYFYEVRTTSFRAVRKALLLK